VAIAYPAGGEAQVSECPGPTRLQAGDVLRTLTPGGHG